MESVNQHCTPFMKVYIIYCNTAVKGLTDIIIDKFNYRAWHFIILFIDYAIQIYVGKKLGKINGE